MRSLQRRTGKACAPWLRVRTMQYARPKTSVPCFAAMCLSRTAQPGFAPRYFELTYFSRRICCTASP